VLTQGSKLKKFLFMMGAEAAYAVGNLRKKIVDGGCDFYDECLKTETIKREDGSELVIYTHGKMMNFLTGGLAVAGAIASLALGVDLVRIVQRGRNVGAGIAALGGAMVGAAGVGGLLYAFAMRPAI
jgi:hypothetical protein